MTATTDTDLVRMSRRQFGGWEVYDRQTGDHLGWVVQQTWADGKPWNAYVADPRELVGHLVGSQIRTRREAVEEVWIQRDRYRLRLT